MAEGTNTTGSASNASPITALQAAATATESKLLTFAKTHYSKLVAAGIGYAAAKVGIFGLIWRII